MVRVAESAMSTFAWVELHLSLRLESGVWRFLGRNREGVRMGQVRGERGNRSGRGDGTPTIKCFFSNLRSSIRCCSIGLELKFAKYCV